MAGLQPALIKLMENLNNFELDIKSHSKRHGRVKKPIPVYCTLSAHEYHRIESVHRELAPILGNKKYRDEPMLRRVRMAMEFSPFIYGGDLTEVKKGDIIGFQSDDNVTPMKDKISEILEYDPVHSIRFRNAFMRKSIKVTECITTLRTIKKALIYRNFALKRGIKTDRLSRLHRDYYINHIINFLRPDPKENKVTKAVAVRLSKASNDSNKAGLAYVRGHYDIDTDLEITHDVYGDMQEIDPTYLDTSSQHDSSQEESFHDTIYSHTPSENHSLAESGTQSVEKAHD